MLYGEWREGKGRADGAAEVRDEGRDALSLLKVVAGRWDGRRRGGQEGGRLGRQGGLPKTDMDCRLFWTSGCGLAKG